MLVDATAAPSDGSGWRAVSTTSPGGSGSSRARSTATPDDPRDRRAGRRRRPPPPLARLPAGPAGPRPVPGPPARSSTTPGTPPPSTSGPSTSSSWLAEVGRRSGSRSFVVDDGWFAGRDERPAGLGDWWPDPVDVPGRARPAHLRSCWTEGCGSASGWSRRRSTPTASCFRAHPDWVYRAGDRPLVTSRNQYVLDFGRPEVRRLDQGLAAPAARRRADQLPQVGHEPPGQRRRPPRRPARPAVVGAARPGLLREMMRMLRAEFPHVTVEACSGRWRPDRPGGARAERRGVAERRDRPAGSAGHPARLPVRVRAARDELLGDRRGRTDSTWSRPASSSGSWSAMAGVLGIGADLTALVRARTWGVVGS